MTGLTATLASFAANPGIVDIPNDAARVVRTGFIDTIATMLAGRDERVVAIMREHVAGRSVSSASQEASVLMSAQRANAQDAALVNGTAAHALDYDDVALGGHPSTVLVPAVLAAAEATGSSGRDAMRAYLVGYEVWAELVSREPDQYHIKGWHPTPVFGTVGAAAAVASLWRLSVEQCGHAIGVAASMSSGLVANFGTMTKPFHAGRAAANAIEAVRLAQRGMTAAPDAIEHHAGFLAAISPAGKVDLASAADTLGKTLRIVESGLSIKKYPMCYATHRVIDGVLDLARANHVRAGDVESVQATVGKAQASMLRNHAPVTALEAKFSLEFAVASALVADSVGLRELDDAFVGRAEVRDTMRKLKIEINDTSCPIEPIFSYADRVTLHLKDGRTLDSGDIRFARGNAKLPLHEEELRLKFLDCAARASGLNGEALFQRLTKLDALADMRSLAAKS